jgi:Flp pilus assembly protein TadG
VGLTTPHVSLLRSLIRNQEGQALPEFALVIPILLIVLFGVLDFGKAINYWNDATHLSAEAARYAAVNRKPNPANANSLQQQIRDQLDTPELKNGTGSVTGAAQVCVDFPNGTSNAGDPVRVRLTFTYSLIPFIGNKISVAQIPVSSSSIMRLEATPTNFSAGCA